MKRIVWLASFPKSGNTWMRLLLAHYFAGANVDLNDIPVGYSASARRLFDSWSVIDSSELTENELLDSRADLFRTIARNAQSPVFLKTHDAWTMSASGRTLFPADATLATVYLVRHPFDVAVSMAHYFAWPLDQAVRLMGSDEFTFRRSPNGISTYFSQLVMSWHRHVGGWIDDSGLPIVVVRYEDLRADAVAWLTTVLRKIGHDVEGERVKQAVRLTAFERLQEQEATRGFNERVGTAKAFFRGGRVGDGHRELALDQQNELIRQHGPTMRRLGYL